MAAGLLYLARTYRTLPRAGGLFDQDSLFVHLATEYERAIAERSAKDQAKANSQMHRSRRH